MPDSKHKSLQGDEEPFRAIFERAAVGMAHVGLDGKFLLVNEALCDLSGFSREELLQRTFQQITHPDDLDLSADICKRLIAGEIQTHSTFEKRYIHKDGRVVWARLMIALVRDCVSDEPRYFVSVIEDITQRKQAELAWHESEKRFRVLVDNAPMLMWMSGADKLCTYFNQPWLDFTGRSMESELGNGWADGVHPDDRQRCWDTYARAFDRREELRMEYRMRRHDGEYRWILDIGVPRYDQNHSFLGYLGSAIDVTESKLADEVRSRYAAIVESSDDAIVGVDTNGVIANWNRGAERLFGYSAQQASGRNISFLSAADSAYDGQNILKRVLNGEVLRHYEIVRQRKNGTRVEISLTASPIVDAEGRIVGVSGIARDITERKRVEGELEKYRQHLEELVRERTSQLEAANAQLQTDITERKRAEKELRDSEGRFRAFFETTVVGAAELDLHGRFAQVNQRLCQITGYSREELLGMTPADLTHPEDRDRDLEQVVACLQGRLPIYDTEKRYIRRDGRVIWVHVVAAMIRDAEGKLLRSAGIIQEITERRRAEQALFRSEKLASIGRMAATIAHEINNPLDAVMNLIFLARNTKDLPVSTRDLLEAADTEMKRVAHITRQSLGFYRESNAAALTSVNAILDSAIELQKSRIKAKHAIIDKRWREDVQITAVGGELRQVFSNLVSNSLDAIEERGTVKVRVSKGNHHARITVADNGKGIPPTIRQHIFEPFFTTKDKVGTGLGLWVSQQIIEKHGGRIRVRSNTNGVRRGTTFSVVLPVEPTSAQSQSTAA